MRLHEWGNRTGCLGHRSRLWLANENNNRDFLLRSFLLGSQGLHGFEGGGAPRGDETSYDRGDEQQEGDGGEDGEVELSDSVEGALHTAADEVGSDEADGEADDRENQAFADDEGDDAAAICAERHAKGSFVRALRYRDGKDFG